MGEPVRHVIDNKNYMDQRIVSPATSGEDLIFCECCDDPWADCGCSHEADEYCV